MTDLSDDKEGRNPIMSMESGSRPNGKAQLDTDSGRSNMSDVKMKEGGYGWVIVGASFFNMFCLDGLISIYGLLYPDLLANFGAEPAITALPGSLVVGMSCFLGPVCGKLIRRFGVRKIVVLGSFVTSVGFVCSFSAQSITALFFTHGLLTGIGCGLFYLPSITLVNTYFDRKRGIAQGIITAGSGMGVIVLSPLTKFLMGQYGWRGVLLLWAGFVLNISISGLLMRPSPEQGNNSRHGNPMESNPDPQNSSQVKHYVWSYCSLNKNDCPEKQNDEIQNGRTPNRFVYVENIDHSSTRSLPHHYIDKQDISSEHIGPYRSLQCVHHPKPKQHKQRPNCVENMFDRTDIFLTGSTNILKTHASNKSFHSKHVEEMVLTDISVLDNTSYMTSDSDVRCGKCTFKPFTKDPAFLLLVAGSVMAQMAQHIPMTFIPDYCEQIGLESKDIASLFILFGVVNMAGRFGSGLLASLRMFSPLVVCNLGSIACGVACLLFWLCTSFETLAVFIAIYGFFVGFSCPTQPLITLEYVGLENLTPAFGLVTMAKGPAAMVGPPLAGGLYQLTQNYYYAIVFAGGLLGLSGVGQSIMPFVAKYRLQKQEAPDTVVMPPDLDDADATSGEQDSRGNHL
ncbi:uncharacterized protein LOC117323036 isoform X2 [Pecten maximus]|nr:uncharacterized protein LOC117323036 isoform X2 [Pecten maximus]